MQKIVKKDGKNVKLDTENDELIYSGHENTGPRQNRWIEMYAHRLKSAGKLADGEDPDPNDYVFYLLHVSLWQGENTYIQELTVDEAREFVMENYNDLSTRDDAKMVSFGLLDESKFE